MIVEKNTTVLNEAEPVSGFELGLIICFQLESGGHWQVINESKKKLQIFSIGLSS